MAAGRTILVIDDESDIVDILKTVFEDHGYRVVTASDGNAGLSQVEREAPDLVVMDLVMPRTSGLHVLERVKRRPSGGPRVIMITAHEACRHKAYAEQLGVDDYIRKPFEIERLLESVRRLCPP
jgi:DNA-binding response OmpR family regulator